MKGVKKVDAIEKIMIDYGIAPLPGSTPEAMAFVPFQPSNPKLYGAIQGFESGTMFPTLNKPFYGSKCTADRAGDEDD